MASAKVQNNLSRGLFYEEYSTEGLQLVWAEMTPDEGHEIKYQDFETADALEARLREIQPDLRKWRKRPVK